MKQMKGCDQLNYMQSLKVIKFYIQLALPYSLSTEDSSDHIKTKIPTIASDFQCFVCGAVFTTDEDRKQHIEKRFEQSKVCTIINFLYQPDIYGFVFETF